ncbi:YedE family putative selenium transporter [Glaesserella parasuis]|uniref:YedE family putative selenium transporter n=1 Tax=Glaesserella parasuis TaxID=738 RepID=UPI003B675D80
MVAGAALGIVAPLQYIRPELIGLVLGSLAMALLTKEFRPRGGSAPITRIMLGFFAMLGALTFLGCPWRAYLRLGGGDLTSIAGIVGLLVGVFAGIFFFKRGFSLGKSGEQSTASGIVPIFIVIALFIALITQFRFGENLPIFFSEKAPAAQHANLSGAGVLVGIVMQRSRFCSIGAFRNFILSKDNYLLNGIVALAVCTSITNLMLDQFKLGFEQQPIAYNDVVWNFLSMTLCGLCFSLAGGCPGKQLVHLGEGNNDAALFLVGMLLGAAAAHNFSLAASGTGISTFTPYGVGLGLLFCIYIGFTNKSTH